MNWKNSVFVKSEPPDLPELPERLRALAGLAYNLRWAWDPASVDLFRRLDQELWERSDHNPVRLLREIDRDALRRAEESGDFHTRLDAAAADLERYLEAEDTWYGGRDDGAGRLIAYFSTEFGLSECLRIYSGGLGILSGDHLKSASDLGLPLVGVGLFYAEGYVRQGIDQKGRQVVSNPAADPAMLPMMPARGPDGTPVKVAVEFPGRSVHARVWRVQVGRVPLFLLDSDVEENAPADRGIAARLYGGDQETRISQELLLGVGGRRALEALGLEPTTFHMNEGHSSFLVLEQIRRAVREEGSGVEEARERVGHGLVFTTHTPVAAGHDRFPAPLIDRFLAPLAAEIGLSTGELYALAERVSPEGEDEFCMTCLALRSAGHANGVSRLHGAVSREMWRGLWPGSPVEEIPIGHVTNGVHLPSWLSAGMRALLRDAGAGDPSSPDADLPARLASVEDGRLWRVREEARERLAAYVRRAAWRRGKRGGGAGGREFSGEALTIGFARRFTAYKRATLLFSDPERLAAILGDAERPVQVVFSGKAHPRDEAGKEMLTRIARLSRTPKLAGRVELIAGYDIGVARELVQGVDVWLNTPRPPLEASGTSGMKAAANGALNLSTWDGWWAEAWEEHRGPIPIGWVIGPASAATESELADSTRDERDAESLYTLLEEEVVPLFYERDGEGVPVDWLRRVRESMGRLMPFFNADRMVRDYFESYYGRALAPAEADPGR